MEKEINYLLIEEIVSCTLESIKNTIPLNTEFEPVQQVQDHLQIQFGTILEFEGNYNGKLIFSGKKEVFSKIGEAMFGMPLAGEMLHSFTGELGNILAGNLSTIIMDKGVKIDITPPLILESSKISVIYQGAEICVNVYEAGHLFIAILLAA